MVPAKVWWVVFVVRGWDVIFLIVDVLFQVVELCFVLLYYDLATVGAKVIYVKFVS